jgi:hypothetical protein
VSHMPQPVRARCPASRVRSALHSGLTSGPRAVVRGMATQFSCLDDGVVTVWHQSPAAPTFAGGCPEDNNGARHRNCPALFFTGAALADDWKGYENRDYSFTAHFPGDPIVETATYRAADGRSFPAHVFSVKQDTGVFKVTVVDMPGKQTGSDAAVMKEATKAVVGGGTIKSTFRIAFARSTAGNSASSDRTVATPTWRYSIEIIASIRSRATHLSREDRQKLTRCASSSHSISLEVQASRAEPAATTAMWL